MRVGTITLALCLGGCCLIPPPEDPPELPARSAAPTPVTSDGPFAYSEARRSRTAAPTRFAAPWPGDLATLAGEWPPSAPPREQAMRRLCGGDPTAMRAWIDAAQRASANAPRESLITAVDGMIEYCETPALCTRGRETIQAGATDIARDVALLAVARCGRSEDAELVDVDGAPAAARVRWLGEHEGDRPPATPGRVSAARALIALAVEGDFDSESRARRAISAIGRLPRGTEALRALAPSLEAHPAALLREALSSEYFPGGDEEDGAPELAGASPAERQRMATEREACARRGGYEGRSCLEQLAAIDRPRAVALARELGTNDEAMRETVALLDHFPEEDALRERLHTLGLVGEDCEANALDTASVLTECGRAIRFDPETGFFPVHHDALLAELALLAPGALDGVVFEEIAPDDLPGATGADVVVAGGQAIADETPEGAYVLRAYSRGDRFEVSAQSLDDWYDLEAVIGLLNTIARARESDVRWLVIQPTGGNDATVAAGPERGLRTAIAESAIVPVTTRASEDARAAEEVLLRQLLESGELDRLGR